jgi:hypothetical protein
MLAPDWPLRGFFRPGRLWWRWRRLTEKYGTLGSVVRPPAGDRYHRLHVGTVTAVGPRKYAGYRESSEKTP